MEAFPLASIEIVFRAAQFLPQWFVRGEKMGNRYWQCTLIVLICWTGLAAVIGFLVGLPITLLMGAMSAPSPSFTDWIYAGMLALLLVAPVFAVLAVPAWVALAIAWRWAGVGGVVGVLEGLLLFCVVGGLLYSASGSVAASLLLPLPFALPPMVVGILSLLGWGIARTLRNPEGIAQRRLAASLSGKEQK